MQSITSNNSGYSFGQAVTAFLIAAILLIAMGIGCGRYQTTVSEITTEHNFIDSTMQTNFQVIETGFELRFVYDGEDIFWESNRHLYPKRFSTIFPTSSFPQASVIEGYVGKVKHNRKPGALFTPEMVWLGITDEIKANIKKAYRIKEPKK